LFAEARRRRRWRRLAGAAVSLALAAGATAFAVTWSHHPPAAGLRPDAARSAGPGSNAGRPALVAWVDGNSLLHVGDLGTRIQRVVTEANAAPSSPSPIAVPRMANATPGGNMRRTLSVVTATLLATATTTAMTGGFTSAAPVSPVAAASAAAHAHAAARASTAGTEHFRIMSTAATSRQLSVIATGEFTAGGTDIPGKNTDMVVFPGGTLRIRHHSTAFTAKFNPRTCLFTETQRGTYRLGHGTGKLAGISGSGRFAVHILGVFARNSMGSCTHLAAPATFQSVATFVGPISKG